VRLVGVNGTTLFIDLAHPTVINTWVDYSFNLVGSSFKKATSDNSSVSTGAVATDLELQGVLANLKALEILADYRDGSDDTGLDNVRLGVVENNPVFPNPRRMC